MRVLMPVCMQYAEDTMNVVWRNVFVIQDKLKSLGHDVEWVSVISQNDGKKYKRQNEGKLNRFVKQKWDVILVHYSSWYVHIDAARAIIASNPQARVGWMTTDYEINRHEAFNPYHFVISNFDESYYSGSKKFYQDYMMCNLNTLIYSGLNNKTDKKYDCIYYGRYREDRSDYFKKYLTGYISISTSKKNVKKFKIIGCKSNLWSDRICWESGRETLNLFRSYLYIEDKTTHQYFNNLANRFYEGLMCRSIPLVDVNCVPTFVKSGYELPSELIVHSDSDIQDKVMMIKNGNYDHLLDKWDDMAKREKSNTVDKVVDFIVQQSLAPQAQPISEAFPYQATV